jgi:hypothetical protein
VANEPIAAAANVAKRLDPRVASSSAWPTKPTRSDGRFGWIAQFRGAITRSRSSDKGAGQRLGRVFGTHRWRYVYRAVDQHGQIIDVFVSPRRDTPSARRFFETALGAHGEPVEIVTDRARTTRGDRGTDPAAFHNTEQYANNRIEGDHGRLTARLRPMRGLKRDRSARVIVRGLALMQNIRRGHYELGVEALPRRRIAAAFTELARAI